MCVFPCLPRSLSAGFHLTPCPPLLAYGETCCRARVQLRSLMEQYEVREKHFAAILRAKDVEHRLNEARTQQQIELATQEHQKVRRGKWDVGRQMRGWGHPRPRPCLEGPPGTCLRDDPAPVHALGTTPAPLGTTPPRSMPCGPHA